MLKTFLKHQKVNYSEIKNILEVDCYVLQNYVARLFLAIKVNTVEILVGYKLSRNSINTIKLILLEILDRIKFLVKYSKNSYGVE